MKLWIDDVRPAPNMYVWLKSVNEAKECIEFLEEQLEKVSAELRRYSGNNIEIIDIDHDAGDYAIYGGDYIKLLDWLEETVSKAAPNENKTEEDSIPTFTNTFVDKNGGIWRLTENGKWDYVCLDQNCSDCVYYNNDNDRCDVVYPLCEEDRNYKIELANKRMRAKTNEK